MKQTTAQNAYFDALKTVINTGVNNHNMGRLLDEMFSEYNHNRIGEEFNVESELLRIIENRFIDLNLSNNRYLRPYKTSFYSKRDLYKPKSPYDDIIKLISINQTIKEKEVLVGVKIKWVGSKSQMYYVIRQLKEMKLLASSYEDIGLFLIQHIDKFNGSDLGTVINELQKKKYDKIPHDKRTNLLGLKEEKDN